MKRTRWSLASAAVLLPIMLAGCVESSVEVAKDRIVPVEDGIAIQVADRSRTYIINRGDDITVRFYFNPQLDEDLRVRPDGGISLSLIGDVSAVGKTPAQLSETITALYATYLTKPTAVVVMRGFARSRAFVAGEVRTPGVISLQQGTQTVSQALASTGGVTDNSTLRHIILVRRVPGQENPIVMSLNIAAAIEGKDPRQDLVMLPDDLVYVPKSAVADVSLAIHLYFINMFSGTGFGITPGV